MFIKPLAVRMAKRLHPAGFAQAKVVCTSALEVVRTRYPKWTHIGRNAKMAALRPYWDEQSYLKANPKALQSVRSGRYKSGLHHWLARHNKDTCHLQPPAHWMEQAYLQMHADVAAAVERGAMPSGYAHYLLVGAQEKRSLPFRMQQHSAPPYPLSAAEITEITARWQEEDYLQKHADVQQAVDEGYYSTGLDHLLRKGIAQKREVCSLYWDEPGYLEIHTDVADAIDAGMFVTGYEHYRRHGAQEERRLPVYRGPQWVVDEMLALSEIEPLLYPTTSFFAGCSFHDATKEKEAGEALLALLATVGETKYTHVFVLPWLTRGGADMGALHHINTLAKDAKAKILVLTTEHVVSPWASRLPKTAVYIDFASYFSKKTKTEIKQVALARVLLHISAPVVHNINCDLMWKTTVSYGRALAQHSRLYASLFAFGYTDAGEPHGYPFYLDRCWQHLHAILTDHQAFTDTLCALYGLPESLCIPVRFPVHCVKRFAIPVVGRDKMPMRLLWASRIDKEKRPDQLLRIAQQLPDVLFDVFGEAKKYKSGKIEGYLAQLKAQPNICFKGPFDGFDSIPLQPYQALVYTTVSDGLPNILLEAIASGLLVIAPDVGGIGELMQPKTPAFVADKDAVSQFVAAIRWLQAHPNAATEARAAQAGHVTARHSDSAFLKAINNLPDYTTCQSVT